MFLLISYIKKIDIYFDIYTQIKKHTIILSCKKEKVIFLQMGNMKSNLSNNVLDSCYYKSLIYLPAIFQLFLLCNITIVNKRTKENTEWENIIHSKLQPLLFFLRRKNLFIRLLYETLHSLLALSEILVVSIATSRVATGLNYILKRAHKK